MKIIIKNTVNLTKKRGFESEAKDNIENPRKRMKFVIKKNGLKLVSSPAVYITKTPPLGEDGHFVAAREQTIGVADGVGGWAKKGIDSGEYARALMKNSIITVRKEAKEKSKVDLKTVLEEAFSKTKFPGASTACIATHDDGILRAINVGDSGFMVFRERKLLYKSPTQQRRFNCPFQLGNHKKCQRPDCAMQMEMEVKEGDIIVMGTDGLLDNMYPSEIEEIIETEKEGMEKDLAIKIAEKAVLHAMDEHYVSPFQIANEMAGKKHKGGKMDDITVIVGKITQHYDIQLHK